MAKKTLHYIQKVQKQHRSLIVTIPKTVRDILGILAGDYAVFEIDEETKAVELQKFTMKGKSHGQNTEHTD